MGGRCPIFFLPQILFFCELKPHAKFRNPRTTPSGRKVCVGGGWVGGGWVVEGKFSVSFGPTDQDLGFVFGLGPSWTIWIWCVGNRGNNHLNVNCWKYPNLRIKSSLLYRLIPKTFISLRKWWKDEVKNMDLNCGK